MADLLTRLLGPAGSGLAVDGCPGRPLRHADVQREVRGLGGAGHLATKEITCRMVDGMSDD